MKFLAQGIFDAAKQERQLHRRKLEHLDTVTNISDLRNSAYFSPLPGNSPSTMNPINTAASEQTEKEEEEEVTAHPQQPNGVPAILDIVESSRPYVPCWLPESLVAVSSLVSSVCSISGVSRTLPALSISCCVFFFLGTAGLFWTNVDYGILSHVLKHFKANVTLMLALSNVVLDVCVPEYPHHWAGSLHLFGGIAVWIFIDATIRQTRFFGYAVHLYGGIAVIVRTFDAFVGQFIYGATNGLDTIILLPNIMPEMTCLGLKRVIWLALLGICMSVWCFSLCDKDRYMLRWFEDNTPRHLHVSKLLDEELRDMLDAMAADANATRAAYQRYVVCSLKVESSARLSGGMAGLVFSRRSIVIRTKA